MISYVVINKQSLRIDVIEKRRETRQANHPIDPESPAYIASRKIFQVFEI
jgi:hypothetical protein